MDRKELDQVRGKELSMIFQDPLSSLNPVLTIGKQLEEGLKAHTELGKEERRKRALDLLGRAGIREAEAVMKKYPHQLSGGMLQRIMIGLALAMKPALLVADEPTTAIDAITQAEILKEFQRIKEESHTAMIFISHDLGAVSKIADEIVVMNGGKLVEQGDFEHILRHAKDPYTRMLAETRRSVMERYRLCLDNQEELCLN